MKSCSVGAELFRANSQTDRHEANSHILKFCKCAWKQMTLKG